MLNQLSECYSHVAALNRGVTKGILRDNFGTIYRGIRDVNSNKVRSFGIPFFYDNDLNLNMSLLPAESLANQTITISPSCSKRVVFTQDGEGDASKYYAEIWNNSSLMHRVELTDCHSKVLDEGWFGGFSWSATEDLLAYVTVKKAPKVVKTSLFDSAPKADPAANEIKANDEWWNGNDIGTSKFSYREDWGEKYVGIGETSICLLHTQSGRHICLNHPILNDITIGQPAIDPADSSRVVFTGWSNLPRRLGMLYCHHRPCALYEVRLKKSMTVLLTGKPDENENDDGGRLLTRGIAQARQARFYPAGSKLVFFGSRVGYGSHNGPCEVMEIDFGLHISQTADIDGSGIRTVAGGVMRPSVTPLHGGFPGLWSPTISERPFVNSNQLVITSSWGSSNAVVLIDTESGHVTRLTELCSGGESVVCLDVHFNQLMFERSSPNDPGRFGIARLSSSSVASVSPVLVDVGASAVCTSVWSNDVQDFSSIERQIRNISWSVEEVCPTCLTHESSPICDQPFEVIFCRPNKSASFDGQGGAVDMKKPLIVVPHGGPHSVFANNFLSSVAFLCVVGDLNVLLVNYRGSIGFGGDFMNCLVGKIGTVDVSDVKAAIDHVIGKYDSLIDVSNIGIVGGSHGGFLTAHMIGQFPDLFSAAVMRNPVVNIPGMVSVTDIPDWCNIEAMGLSSYDFSTFSPPTAEILNKMMSVSPCRYIDQVKTPTLLCIGAKDRRVPPSQGFEYYHALRSRGVKTKVQLYPEDTHALDLPGTEADHWIHILGWMQSHFT